eukprot:Protomagalhaensia_sp_Gyna_25__5971@NODE_925_length_2414_cov_38_129684_g731_i0_p2_GENE_NODE_925_length_2414_cov_38_129684_g731_i0NODE_925_length_2414_cov_38_129684_g731_i0_p2_ORF_typecomplete_len388_score57_30DUF218/PF02698_17/0_18DUF218/PF02698_17/6_6e03_NODE_925_length_2414_cov_38_129684_g731_i012492412
MRTFGPISDFEFMSGMRSPTTPRYFGRSSPVARQFIGSRQPQFGIDRQVAQELQYFRPGWHPELSPQIVPEQRHFATNYIYARPPQPLVPIIQKVGAPGLTRVHSADFSGSYAAPLTHSAGIPAFAPESVYPYEWYPPPTRHVVVPSGTASEPRSRWARKKKALTYSQCEILNEQDEQRGQQSSDGHILRQRSLQLGRRESGSLATRSASLSHLHRHQLRIPPSGMMGVLGREEEQYEPERMDHYARQNGVPQERSIQRQNIESELMMNQDSVQNLSRTSASAGVPETAALAGVPDTPEQFVFDGTLGSLEQLKMINEKNLALARNRHVKDIYRSLQQAPRGQPVSSGGLRIADMDQARQTLQALNPGIQNSGTESTEPSVLWSEAP